jgi:hypothetical protein
MAAPISPTAQTNGTYYYTISNGSSDKDFQAPPVGSGSQIKVIWNGEELPQDDPDYPWTHDEDDDEVNFSSDGPPDGEMAITRETFLDFNKLSFPPGYTADARTLNKFFTNSLYQAQEIVDIADYVNTSWANSDNLAPPTSAQEDDHTLITGSNNWQIKTPTTSRIALNLHTTDNNIRFTSLSGVDYIKAGNFGPIVAGGPHQFQADTFSSLGNILSETTGQWTGGDEGQADIHTLGGGTDNILTISNNDDKNLTLSSDTGGIFFGFDTDLNVTNNTNWNTKSCVFGIDTSGNWSSRLGAIGPAAERLLDPSGGNVILTKNSITSTGNSTMVRAHTWNGSISYPLYGYSPAGQTDGSDLSDNYRNGAFTWLTGGRTTYIKSDNSKAVLLQLIKFNIDSGGPFAPQWEGVLDLYGASYATKGGNYYPLSMFLSVHEDSPTIAPPSDGYIVIEFRRLDTGLSIDNTYDLYLRGGLVFKGDYN